MTLTLVKNEKEPALVGLFHNHKLFDSLFEAEQFVKFLNNKEKDGWYYQIEINESSICVLAYDESSRFVGRI